MSHDQAEGIVGITGGAVLTIVVQAANWMQGATIAGDVLHALFTGAIGGLAGYGVKWIIERRTKRK